MRKVGKGGGDGYGRAGRTGGIGGAGGGGDAVLKLTMLAVGSDGDRGGVWEV